MVIALCPELTPLTDTSFGATTLKLVEVAGMYRICREAALAGHGLPRYNGTKSRATAKTGIKMATVLEIIDRVTFVTKDVDHERWSTEELIAWINDAIAQIASIHPRAASQYMILNLAAGSRQDLRTIAPSIRWVRLHELVCNANANTPNGTTIRQIPRPSLDFAKRTWRAGTLSAEVKEYAMDEREVFTFDVNPPVSAGTQVYALTSIRPDPVEDEDEQFPLPDAYYIPAVDYVLFRAFSKDANDQSYAARASGHLQAFQLSMGVETGDAGAK